MPRFPRVVLPGHPHHVTQRGNRRQRVFFSADDYRFYLRLLAESCAGCNTTCWAYCLMPNHVHLVLVPRNTDGLRETLAEAHRRYTRYINLREGWRGHLWQERFRSFPMDEFHLIAAVRYIERNPVEAGLARKACDWPWSSASPHLRGVDDPLVTVDPMLELVPDWEAYLSRGDDPATIECIRRHSRSGRPAGSERFIAMAERLAGRRLRPRARGRKPQQHGPRANGK
ncbi:MAG: transposase [Gammaproteobacteria bacterium]|nr:transposase [Gammaproteobacteria bacterium]